MRQITTKLIAGDTYKVTLSSEEYNADDGYGLSLKLNGPSGNAPQKYSFSANVGSSNTSFDLHVNAATTANLAGGLYTYALVAANTTDSYTIESGNLTVQPRADLTESTDLRSHNQKVYDAICAVIENRASQDQQSYTIAGRQLNRIPIRDLLEFKKHYEDLIQKEQGTSQKKLFIRFS